MARKCFNGALHINIINSEAHHGLGLALAHGNNTQRGLKHLKTAFELDPTNAAVC